MGSYEFLEHLADIKVRCESQTLSGCFEESVKAMSNYLISDREINAKESRKFSITSSDLKELLFKFLDEILFIVDTEGYIPVRCEVKIKKNTLNAKLFGEISKKYKLQQIKAATYSEMQIIKVKGKTVIEFVLDV